MPAAWLTLQSHRGLAPNTLDAYSRALERYCASWHNSISLAYRSHAQRSDSTWPVCRPVALRLSNATMQQLLTVIRLFHAYLMEEGVRANNPAAHGHAGRLLIARHHKLPWIPNEDDWHSGSCRGPAVSRSATASCWRSPTMQDCGVKNCAVSAAMTSILRGVHSEFARRPPRGAANEWFHIRPPAVNCFTTISCIGAHSGRGADPSSFQSRDATTPSRSRSGAGRR